MINTPKRCFIFRLVGWVPVILINAIAVWSYFAYVIILCFDAIDNPLERGLYLVLYHPFFIMFMASYWKTILAPPGFVPKKFYLTAEELDLYENNENPKEVLKEKAKELPILTYTVDKGIRYCEVCVLVKPDRCHHCSMCQRCILKMDHHCPWVNNCVGWANYKFFVLFLAYSILYTMYVALSSLKYFIKFWSGHGLDTRTSMHILFLFFVALMFSISLWSLLGFHCFLIAKNRSTLETFRAATFEHGPDKSGFDLGKINNFKQIFGNKKLLWFLPVFTTLGNGVNYRTAAILEPAENNRLLNNTYEESIDDDDSTLNTVTVMGNINLTQIDEDSDAENTIFEISNGKIHHT